MLKLDGGIGAIVVITGPWIEAPAADIGCIACGDGVDTRCGGAMELTGMTPPGIIIGADIAPKPAVSVWSPAEAGTTQCRFAEFMS